MEELSYLELQTTPTIQLVNLLSEARALENQELVNTYAWTLAKRIYVPNASISIEQLLTDFGFKKIEKEQPKVYTKKRK